VPGPDRQLDEVFARLAALESQLERMQAELQRLLARANDEPKASPAPELVEARRRAIHARARSAIADL
jgi:prefoldin subunit 5